MPLDLVRRRAQQVDNSSYRLMQSIDKILIIKKNKLSLLTQTVESHDIQKTLKKGFVLVRQDENYVKRAGALESDKALTLRFYDGDVDIKRGK